MLQDLVFDYTFAPGDDPNKLRVFQISGSRDITFRNVLFDGDLASGVGPKLDGFPTAQGVVIRGCRNITLEGSDIRNWFRGMVISESTGIVLRGNRVHDIRSDGVDFAQVRDVLVEGNHFGPFLRALDAGDHADMIQFWTNGTTTPPKTSPCATMCSSLGRAAIPSRSSCATKRWIPGRRGREMFYRNVTITGNVIVNAHLHGITVGATDGLVIANNTLVRNAASSGPGGSAALWTPSIRVATNSENVAITANVTPAITGPDKRPDWQVAGNLITQESDPARPGHVDALFAAPRSGAPATLAPFTYLPEGPVDGVRLGAGGLRAEIVAGGAEAPLALIRITRDPRWVNRFGFDAGLSRNGDGSAPRWDFGDGTTAQGATVAHDYAAPGTYRVTLTVAPGGGPAEAAVRVTVPPAEMLRFGAGTEGLLGWQNGSLQPLPEIAVSRGPDGVPVIPLGQGQHPPRSPAAPSRACSARTISRWPCACARWGRPRRARFCASRTPWVCRSARPAASMPGSCPGARRNR